MYDGPADFVARTLPIVQRARTDGAAVLVVVPEPRLTALRTAVGEATTDVTFTDMTTVGRNPGRIISVWDDFVRGQAGGRVVGIGEPIWSGRSRDELIECQIHEELLDTAFAESEGVEIQCPYDVGSLSGDVITEACRAHGPSASTSDRNPFWKPLRPAPEGAYLQSFDERGVRDLRGLIAGLAEHVGLGSERTARPRARRQRDRHEQRAPRWRRRDTSSLDRRRCGGLRSERRRLPARPAGRSPSTTPDAMGGRGLWLANQLCDLVQVRNGVEGCVVRVRVEGCRVR